METEAAKFGSDRGYFVLERDESVAGGGISVLAKVVSLEAAYRLVELVEQLTQPGSERYSAQS